MARPRAPGDGKSGGDVTPLRPRVKCPVCGKPSDRTHHPFCSRRCADIDLNRWLSGSYGIPGRPLDETEDSPARKEDDDGEDR